MSVATAPIPSQPGKSASARTLADLLRELGDVPADRVLLNPPPGTATETDLLRLVDGDEKVLVELVDGTLVEKPVGHRESLLAAAIVSAMGPVVRSNRLGLVYGADATLRMRGGNIRLPDVSFVAWAHVPSGRVPPEAVPVMAPTIAVEILSATNTKREMEQKRREYFASGTKLVWEVNPDARTVTVYTDPDSPRILGQADVLDAGALLPGFVLPLRDLFAQLDQRPPSHTS